MKERKKKIVIGPPTLVDPEDQVEDEDPFTQHAPYDGFLQQQRVRASTLEPAPNMKRPLVAGRLSFNKQSNPNADESHAATPPSMGQTLAMRMG